MIHPLLRRNTQLSRAQAHTFWVVKMVLSLCGLRGFPGGSDGRASVCNEGEPGLIPRSEDLLEKEMATHSSILAWKIPWVEEPGGLRSMGSQRVRHG